MTSPCWSDWELVVGLEMHAELNTASKLFSGAPNGFGEVPNTLISPICTGQPGALPVLNRMAVEKAIRLGCALGSKILPVSHFDRKSYFYPDSPRNFQITQHETPILQGGTLVAYVGDQLKSFSIAEAHLEDDAATLKHCDYFAGIDFNRAGIPLIEIVSAPCLFSPEEAVAYATTLRRVLRYLDVSDCNMEEGSLRMDVNVSVRKKGEGGLRNKMEIKNMNSFRFMEQALAFEFQRQVMWYHTHPEEQMVPSTYRWSSENKETVLMRHKEGVEGYYYFREPDLPDLHISAEWIDHVRASIPKLPHERIHRYRIEYQLHWEHVLQLVEDRELSDYFDLILLHLPSSLAQAAANWLLIEFGGRYKESRTPLWKTGIPPLHLATLVHMIAQGSLTGTIAKQVADLMVISPHLSPLQIVQDHPDLALLDDDALLVSIVEQVLVDHAVVVMDYQNGKERAFGFLVGQVMKATSGKAPPEKVHDLLKARL